MTENSDRPPPANDARIVVLARPEPIEVEPAKTAVLVVDLAVIAESHGIRST